MLIERTDIVLSKVKTLKWLMDRQVLISPYALNASQNEKVWDPNLSDTQDISDRHIQANDGEIGHVEDLIIDDESWEIRYLIINTQNWWPGKKVLVSPQEIERISWNESKVFVNLTREMIRPPKGIPTEANQKKRFGIINFI